MIWQIFHVTCFPHTLEWSDFIKSLQKYFTYLVTFVGHSSPGVLAYLLAMHPINRTVYVQKVLFSFLRLEINNNQAIWMQVNKWIPSSTWSLGRVLSFNRSNKTMGFIRNITPAIKDGISHFTDTIAAQGNRLAIIPQKLCKYSQRYS